jgi:nucleotide-binding universal stress UspA family protein
MDLFQRGAIFSMFTTLLVPLDGSRRAEAALPLAARLAHHNGATLVLVRVVSVLSEYWPTISTAYPSLTESAVEADMAEASAYLKEVAASRELAGLCIKTTVHYGPVVPTILSVATSYASNLIVLSSHGSAGMIHWMMGSVAEKIARHATIPVLVVREGGVPADSAFADPSKPVRMLVPLDGSLGAQAALEPGAALLNAFALPGQQTALHLVRVCQPFSTTGRHLDREWQDEEELARAKESLRSTVERIQTGDLAPGISQQCLPVTWSVIRDMDIARALVGIAEQRGEVQSTDNAEGCQLIALSTHGRSGFQRWMLGSITERVLHATTLPILVVRPPEPAAGRASGSQFSLSGSSTER